MTAPIIVSGEVEGHRHTQPFFKWGKAPGRGHLFCQENQDGSSSKLIYATDSSTPCVYEEENRNTVVGPVHESRDDPDWWSVGSGGALLEEYETLENYSRFRNIQNLCCMSHTTPELTYLFGGGKDEEASGGPVYRCWPFSASATTQDGSVQTTLYLHHKFYSINKDKNFDSQEGFYFVVSDSAAPVLSQEWDSLGTYPMGVEDAPFSTTEEQENGGGGPIDSPESLRAKVNVPYSVAGNPSWFADDSTVSFMLASISADGNRALILVYSGSIGWDWGGRPTTALVEILELNIAAVVSQSSNTAVLEDIIIRSRIVASVRSFPPPPEEEEPEMLSLMELIAAHNIARFQNGLSLLEPVASLTQASQNHADWLMQNDTRGHTGADGSSPKDRALAAGYPGPYYGENVATGQKSIPEVMQAWANSPGHWQNILDPTWDHIGVGYACNEETMWKNFWVVKFGSTEEDVEIDNPEDVPYCAEEEEVVELHEAETLSSGSMSTEPSTVIGVTDYDNVSFLQPGYEDVTCHISPSGGQQPGVSSYFNASAQGSRTQTTSASVESNVVGAFYGRSGTIEFVKITTTESNESVQGGLSDLSMWGNLQYGYKLEDGVVTEKRGVGSSLTMSATRGGVSRTRQVTTLIEFGNDHSFNITASLQVSGGGGTETAVYETREGALGEKPEVWEVWEVVNTTSDPIVYSSEAEVDFPFPALPSFSKSVNISKHGETLSSINVPDITTCATLMAEPVGICSPFTHVFSRHSAPSSVWNGSVGWPYDLIGTATDTQLGPFGRWLEFYIDFHAGCEVASIVAFTGDYNHSSRPGGSAQMQTVLRSPLLTLDGWVGQPLGYEAGGYIFSGDHGDSTVEGYAGFYDKNRDCASYNSVTKCGIYGVNAPVNWAGDWADPECWPTWESTESVFPPEAMLPPEAEMAVFIPENPEES